jgi:hypothetical protein
LSIASLPETSCDAPEAGARKLDDSRSFVEAINQSDMGEPKARARSPSLPYFYSTSARNLR